MVNGLAYMEWIFPQEKPILKNKDPNMQSAKMCHWHLSSREEEKWLANASKIYSVGYSLGNPSEYNPDIH